MRDDSEVELTGIGEQAMRWRLRVTLTAVAVAAASALGVGAAAPAAAQPEPLEEMVFVVNAFDFPDALAASAVGGSVGGPMVLTGSDELAGPAEQAVIADTVVDDVAALGYEVRRVAGPTRVDVAGRDTLRLEGMNVQVTNGEGATDTTNGLGNLIVGYHEDRTCDPAEDDCPESSDHSPDERTGSHMLVTGIDHTYTAFGGLLAGHDHIASGDWAAVTGGSGNTATSRWASVSGGQTNLAATVRSSILGGVDNSVVVSDGCHPEC